MATENTLPTFQDGEKYLDCILQKGEHEYESVSRKQISKELIEVEVVCIDCGFLSHVYNYIQEYDDYSF